MSEESDRSISGDRWHWWTPFSPMSGRWAFSAAVRVFLAVAVIAGIGAATGGLVSIGVMYFGAACTAVFASVGEPRTRAVTVASQAIGATVGILLGRVGDSSSVWIVAVAAVVAFAAGMIGALGTVAAAGGMTAVIGLAYAQFGSIPLPSWQIACWYVLGSAVVFAAVLGPWLLTKRSHERIAVAAIIAASADLLDAVGTTEASARRADLASASAAGREAIEDNRFLGGRDSDPNRDAFETAQAIALAAAALYAEGTRISASLSAAVRECAARVLAAQDPHLSSPFPTPTPGLVLLSKALHGSVARTFVSTTGAARANGGRSGGREHLRHIRRLREVVAPRALLGGARLALCMTIATGVTVAIHEQSHSYWLPLTVAVVVRPEFGSIFFRTTNRVAGTVLGATLAAIVLTISSSGWVVAIASALAAAFAVFAAPRLYGLSVVGVTCCALLAANISAADPVDPTVRVLDTLIGCAIALTFGYLLWPDRSALPQQARLDSVASAINAYLQQAAMPVTESTALAESRDRAYRLAHQARISLFAALHDPPPVSTKARLALPTALAFEDLVDDVTLLTDQVGVLGFDSDELRDVTARISSLASQSGDQRSSPTNARGPEHSTGITAALEQRISQAESDALAMRGSRSE